MGESSQRLATDRLARRSRGDIRHFQEFQRSEISQVVQDSTSNGVPPPAAMHHGSKEAYAAYLD